MRVQVFTLNFCVYTTAGAENTTFWERLCVGGNAAAARERHSWPPPNTATGPRSSLTWKFYPDPKWKLHHFKHEHESFSKRCCVNGKLFRNDRLCFDRRADRIKSMKGWWRYGSGIRAEIERFQLALFVYSVEEGLSSPREGLKCFLRCFRAPVWLKKRKTQESLFTKRPLWGFFLQPCSRPPCLSGFCSVRSWIKLHDAETLGVQTGDSTLSAARGGAET